MPDKIEKSSGNIFADIGLDYILTAGWKLPTSKDPLYSK